MMVGATLRMLVEVLDHVASFIDCVEGGMYVLMQVAALAMMGFFIMKRQDFINCLVLIDKSEQLLKWNGLVVDYKFMHIMLYVFLSVYPIYIFICVFPVWEVKYSWDNEGFSYKVQCFIFQFINLFWVFMIRHVPLYFFITFLYTAYHRLKLMNNRVLVVEQYNSTSFTEIDQVLSLIEILHNYMYQLARHTEAAFSLAMFLNLTITFLELVTLFVNLRYSENMETYQALVGFIIFAFEGFCILVICVILQSQAEVTIRYISELTLSYLNATLGKKKKFILLQFTHEIIKLNAGGFYDLDMYVLTSHMGMISRILMFLLQLRDDLIAG